MVIATYKEIKYSIPVLAGVVLDVAEVDFEVDFVEVEVTSVVDGFAEVVEVLDDEAVVELVVATGRHWPVIVSREIYISRRVHTVPRVVVCTHVARDTRSRAGPSYDLVSISRFVKNI